MQTLPLADLEEEKQARACIQIYFRFWSVAESQSKPSYRPSPVVAQQAWMNH
jgi:hypothetical protein